MRATQGAGRRARAANGLEPESGSRWRTRLTGGARAAVGERRRRTGRAGKGDMGRRRGFGLRREKRKEKEIGPKEKERGARVWAGLKAGEREKSWFSIFESDSNISIQIQIQRIQI